MLTYEYIVCMVAWFSIPIRVPRTCEYIHGEREMGDGEKANGDGNCWLVTLESARIAAIAGNTGGLHHEEWEQHRHGSFSFLFFFLF